MWLDGTKVNERIEARYELWKDPVEVDRRLRRLMTRKTVGIGDELPEELAFREGRLEKIRKAMAELETKLRRLRSRQRQRVKGIRGIRACPTTKRSATSPMLSRASCPLPAVGTL